MSFSEADQLQLKELREENSMLFAQLNSMEGELDRLYREVALKNNRDDALLRDELIQNLIALERSRLAEAYLKTLFADFLDMANVRKNARKYHKLLNFFTGKAKGKVLAAQLSSLWKDKGLGGLKFFIKNENVQASQLAAAITDIARAERDAGKNEASASLALLAWMLEPQQFRLKWLIFRLHDAHETIKADILLDFLDRDQISKENELSKIEKIKKESGRLYASAILKSSPIYKIVSKMTSTSYFNIIDKLDNIEEKIDKLQRA